MMGETLAQPTPEPESTAPTGRVVRVVEEAPESWQPLVVIDLDELRADHKDPAWQDFLQRAVEYRRELRDSGRLR